MSDDGFNKGSVSSSTRTHDQMGKLKQAKRKDLPLNWGTLGDPAVKTNAADPSKKQPTI